jgi:hypothetical protein
MGATEEYADLILILSALSFFLFAWHLTRAVRMYQHHHDDRAAVALVKAIGLLVISGGLMISSIGLIMQDAQFSIVGLSISRGALIMIALTIIFADMRRVADPAEWNHIERRKETQE